MVISTSRKLSILKKHMPLFHEVSISAICFHCFLGHKYFASCVVWPSAATCHFYFLPKNCAYRCFLCNGPILGDLNYRRNVLSACMLFKVRSDPPSFASIASNGLCAGQEYTPRLESAIAGSQSTAAATSSSIASWPLLLSTGAL